MDSIIVGTNISPDLVVSLIQWIVNQPFVGQYALAIGGIFAVVSAIAKAITAVTNTPKPGTWKAKLYTILLELPAINIGKAKQTGLEVKPVSNS